jgi:2'-5' RNA ligase
VVVGRLFLAVDLVPEVRHGLAAHLDNALGGRRLPGRPVRPESWHLTMRFLGDTDEAGFDRIRAGLDAAARGEVFSIGFAGLGAFPRPQRATVLWLGIDRGGAELAALAGVCEEAARAAGFDPEERPFSAHLTLSRIRPHQDVHALVEAVPPFPLTQTVTEVVLFQSHLGRGGARYEVLDRFPLE